jgi:hypothetical protein
MYPHPIPKTPNYYSQKEYPTLPKDGWIKPCINKDCNTFTSKFLILDNKKFYCCKTCFKKFDMEEYIKQFI